VLDRLNDVLDTIREIAGKDLLVVTGAPKSGTTWLQRTLNSHPEIYCPGEGKFTSFMAGFVRSVTDYNQALSYTNQVVYGEGAYYNVWADENIATAFQFLVALSWATSNKKDLSGVRYIGDKDTDYGTAIEAWRDSLFPGARFVHAIRDGRDAAISNLYHRGRVTGQPPDFESARFHQLLEGYGREWSNHIRKFRAAFRDRADRYHEVRYEDLLTEPEARVGAILAFLGVDRTPERVHRMVAENAFQKLSGGREAGQEDRSSFYRKGVAGEWRTHLDERARKVFAEACGGLLEELGYEP
jgi:hypothetical protein